jgi:hypothetical protein
LTDLLDDFVSEIERTKEVLVSDLSDLSADLPDDRMCQLRDDDI